MLSLVRINLPEDKVCVGSQYKFYDQKNVFVLITDQDCNLLYSPTLNQNILTVTNKGNNNYYRIQLWKF